MLELIPSGSPGVGSYYTLTAGGDNYSSSYSGSGTTTITLPSGFYMARCTLSITRSTSNQNIQFVVEVDGSDGDRMGITGWYNNLRGDYSEHAFTLTTSGELKVRVTAFEASAPTVTNNSRLWLWRVA